MNKQIDVRTEEMAAKVLFNSGPTCIKLEGNVNKNRSKFRHFARQVSGEVFDVPEKNQVIFSYTKQHMKTFQTGQMSFSLADLSMESPEAMFDSEYYPQISFLFVHRDFQCQGFGTLLLNEGLKIVKNHCKSRPVRLQSAQDAVTFFQKCGFQIVGEPIDVMHCGSRLFKTLVNMQLDMQ
ncbi:uncharacterized protein LOC128214511 [Mya arenaria]|nr:uncharacterized protein LOC128214511 [Mya arenaria]